MPDVKNVKKRPVVIQGVHLDEGMTAVDLYDAAEWCGGTVASNDSGPTGVVLETLDGNTATVHPGWWILKGVAGEFYPCAPDVFASTYDVVGDENAPLTNRLFVRGLLPIDDLPFWVVDGPGLSQRGYDAMFGSEFTEGVPNFSALEEPLAWVLTPEEDAGFFTAEEAEEREKPMESIGDYIVRRDKERQEDGQKYAHEEALRAIMADNPSPAVAQSRFNEHVEALRDALARGRA